MSNPFDKLRTRGFSLVEMMITLGLIAIISGFGIRSSFRSTEQKKITEGAETIRQYYVQAKSQALAGKKDCTVCGAAGGICGNGDGPLSGWRVTVNTGASPVSYEIHGECLVAGVTTTFYPSGTKTMPKSLTVTITGPAGDIIFLPLNSGVNAILDSTITINSTTTGMTAKSFTINKQGEISAVQ